MIINILKTMFSYPNGIVLGNLIAAVIGWVAGIVFMHFKDKKHRQHIKEIHAHLIKKA